MSIESLSDKPLAELIKKIRSINELTQESLGQLFEPSVTQPTVARWEKGEQMPDPIHFPKIAYFLDLTHEKLQQLVENPSISVDTLHIEKKIFTPNKKHLNILKRGVKAWNKWRDKNPDIIPVLAGIELSGFDLDGINLNDADLRGIKLIHINSRSSSYQRADMRHADLNQVYFFNSDFTNANISHARVIHAYFNDTKLFGVDFFSSRLSMIYLNSANLNNANLSNVKLIDADLRGASCLKTSFENAIICDSNIFGASFIEAKVNGVKLDNVYFSDSSINENRSLPVDDLLSAQSIYLQRYNRAKFISIQHKFKLEKELINLATVLAKKYGSYYYPEKLNIFNDYEANNQPYHVEIQEKSNYLCVRFRHHDRIKLLSERDPDLPPKLDTRREILNINNDIIESDFELEDIDVLKSLISKNEKFQSERVERFVPIACRIIELNKGKDFVGKKYIIEKIDDEIILFSNLKYKMEIMRVKFCKKQLKIIRSNLSKDCLMDFQQLLLDLII